MGNDENLSAEGGRLPRSALEWAMYYAAAATMLGLTGLMAYIMVVRYIFSAAPLWGEDVPRVLFMWTIFLVAPLAIRLGLNIRVEGLVARFSPPVRRVVETVMHLLVLVMLAIIAFSAWPLVKLGYTGTMLTTGWSNSVLRWPILIGACLMFVAQFGQLVRVWQRPSAE